MKIIEHQNYINKYSNFKFYDKGVFILKDGLFHYLKWLTRTLVLWKALNKTIFASKI